jgi:hypothetical protein
MMHLKNRDVELPCLLRLPLQFFAEGNEGSGADMSTGSGEAAPAGDGGTETPTTGDAGAVKTYTPEEVAAVAKQAKLIPHNAVKDRYKSTFDKADKYDAMLTHLGAVAEKYGVSAEDPEGLARAILSNKDAVRVKAAELGVTDEVAKSLLEADAVNAINKARESARVRQEEYTRMSEEEAAVKAVYPTFDFSKAAGNKAFKTLVDSGVPMKEAYEMSHHAELTAAAITAAREQAKAEVRAELEDAASRPKEGAGGQTGNSPTDVSKLHGAALDAFLESFLTR